MAHNETMTNRNAINQSNWWLRAKFYSLYIDKFATDIPGLIEKLPYFKTLGIDCLHLLPHYPSTMHDGGFDITDHTGVRADLGTLEDFKRLCVTAHSQNIRIMVDLVLNHTSSEHPWFREARSSQNNPKRDFYMWSDTGTEYAGAPNVFPDFKDKNWLWNEATGDYYYATFKPNQPDLNWRNEAVVREMLALVDTLVGYGVDGFRLDAITHLVETEGTNSLNTVATHERIREVRTHLDTYHPGTILLGEVIGTTECSRTYFGESNECHLSYNFELMNEMFYALRIKGKKERLQTAIAAARAIPRNASWMTFLRNHDSVILSALEAPRQAELLQAFDPDMRYGFSHNTETVQRLYNLCGDEALVREAFAMLYAIPAASVMYYGDEIGMQNAPLPPGEDDMRYTCRAPFDWAEAEKQMADPHSLFHYVRRLISKG